MIQTPSTIPPAATLRRVLALDEERMRRFRADRRTNVEAYVGPHYTGKTEDASKRRPVNPVAQAINALLPQLVNNNPRHTVIAKRRALLGEAAKLEAALDYTWADLSLVRDVMRPCIIDALTGSLGMAVVGLKASDQMVMIDDEPVDPGQVFVKRVDLDDYVIDGVARTYSERMYEGHRAPVILSQAIESELFKGKEDILKKLTKYSERRDHDRTQRTDSLSISANTGSVMLADMIELYFITVYIGDRAYDVVLPAGEGAPDEYLVAREYEGPPGGRYVRLGYLEVPGQTMPVPFCTLFRDLAEAADRVSAKMIRQMLRTKRVLGYNKASGSDDALAINEAADGDSVGMDNVGSAQVFDIGGVTREFFEAMQFLMSQWNNSAGQVQMLGGSGQLGKTGTATEASILQGNASTRLGDLQRQTGKFAEDISAKIAYYLITDPLISMPVPVRLTGGVVVDLEYSAETRRGGFLDFNFTIEQSSMIRNVDPAIRSQRIIQLFDTLTNMLPLVQAGIVDFAALTRVLEREFQIEDLDQLLMDPTLAMFNDGLLAPTNPSAAKGMPTGNGMVGQQRGAMNQQATPTGV